MDTITVDVVEHVSNLLAAGKYNEALSVPNDEKFIESFKDNCWDVISVVIRKIEDNTIVIKPSLYGTCEELLTIILEKSSPEEALLEFIEQIELAKNDAQFGLILRPLQQLLKKLSFKRGRSLEWCLNSISTYIENIPIPEYNLEGKERLLLDCDPNIRRISRVYSLLPSFYGPFAQELNAPDPNVKSKQIITAFLISLLGKPLIYIDMDPESNAQSESRLCCATIVKDICILEKNLLKFLPYLKNCSKVNKKSIHTDTDEELSHYEHREKINMTTLSGLFYIVYSGHFDVPEISLPQVYSIEYLIHILLISVNHLLSFIEYGPISKGVILFKKLLDRLPYHSSHTILSSSIHFDVCKNLVNIAVHFRYETIRKNAVSLIGCYINKFDYKGRCTLIQYLLEKANHSGIIGYTITLYKNTLDEGLKELHLPECLKGTQLLHMIQKICHLPHGVESDLVELADQIISALNFLRYLAIKDTENLTGIRDSFVRIETDYLEKLRLGLNMSKAHYEATLKTLESKSYHANSQMETNKISINVGGNILDDIPENQKKEIIISALNAFHLMEGLIARVSECINLNKALNIVYT